MSIKVFSIILGRELFENNEALIDDQDISFLPEGKSFVLDLKGFFSQ